MKRVALGVLAVGLLVGLVLWWRHRGHEVEQPRGGSDPTAIATPKGGTGAPHARALSVAMGAIAGKVHDPAGAAIAGATVYVDALGFEPRTTTTGADGRFTVTGLPVDTYQVAVAASGFVPKVEPKVAVVAAATTPLDVALAPGGQQITGTVSDASGGPIDGAVVTATPRRSAGEVPWAAAATLTDHDGHYRLSLAAGGYQLEASRDDYLPDSTAIDVGAVALTVDLRLVPAGVVEGVVKDVATGAPVAGAVVTAEAAGTAWFAGPMTGYPRTTDADGRFRLTGLSPGLARIDARVEADGRQARDKVDVALAIGETVTGVEVWIEAAPYIAGRVVDAAGAPIAEAHVMAMSSNWGESAVTDADGQFKVLGIEPGSYRLTASADHHLPGAPQAVQVADAPVTGVTLAMTAAAVIRGRVEPATAAVVLLDPDQPVGIRSTNLGAIEGKPTDDAGGFELTPVTPGKHIVAAKATDGRRGTAEVEVSAAATSEVVITLASRGSIAGAVHDQHGAPVVGAAVVITATSGGEHHVIINGVERGADRAITGADGSFAMRGLGAGSYRLGVLDTRGGAMRLAGGKAGASGPAPTVELAADEQKRGVALVVELDDGIIRGVVKDASGAPKADAWVTASFSFDNFRPPPGAGNQTMIISTSDGGFGGGGRAPVLTDAQGRFEVTGLKPGIYDLVAEAERGALRARKDSVTTGASAELVLGGLGAIAGTVKDSAGAPVTDFVVELQGASRQHRRVRSADGRFRIDRLEPDTYTVEIRGASGRGKATATVAAGATAEVTIAVVVEVMVRGRLVDGAGKPLADVMVMAMAAQPGANGTSYSSLGPPEPVEDDGRFELRLAPGDYALMVMGARPSGGPEKRFTVAAGAPLDLGDVAVDDDDGPPDAGR